MYKLKKMKKFIYLLILLFSYTSYGQIGVSVGYGAGFDNQSGGDPDSINEGLVSSLSIGAVYSMEMIDKLNFELDDEKMKQAVKLCNFSELSSQENKKGFVEQVNGKFFRKGKKDSWKEELSSNLKNEIEKSLKKEMQELGYLN